MDGLAFYNHFVIQQNWFGLDLVDLLHNEDFKFQSSPSLVIIFRFWILVYNAAFSRKISNLIVRNLDFSSFVAYLTSVSVVVFTKNFKLHWAQFRFFVFRSLTSVSVVVFTKKFKLNCTQFTFFVFRCSTSASVEKN